MSSAVLRRIIVSVSMGCLYGLFGSLALAAEEPTAEPEGPENARPAPWLMVREGLGIAYGPLGLIADTRVQARTALHRSSSIVFQDTYAGFGGRVRVSPAFVDGGVLVSVAPIDVFDVDFSVDLTGTWPNSSGQLLYSAPVGKTDDERKQRTDKQAPGYRVTISASPTFKIKLGPIIGLHSTEFAYLDHLVPENMETEFVYEAMRDMVVAWRDIVITQFGAVLYEREGADGGSIFRAGGVVRDRQTLRSGDGHTAAGGILMFRKAQVPKSPAIVLLGFAYLRDADRVGEANIQAQLVWSFERPLKRAKAPVRSE